VGEVDREIDLPSQGGDNVHGGLEGLQVMGKTPAKTEDEILKQQKAAAERQQREENAQKAQEFANQEFPGEKWEKLEDGIYLSPRKKTGGGTNYAEELRDAQILRDLGSTVYIAPEDKRVPGRKYDAIVNGLKFELKNVGGNESTLETQFLRSRRQAPNVFINLETSNLSRRQIMSTLYGARNRPTTSKRKGYDGYNQFPGGRIILKIRGQRNLVYLNVDDLEI
jgi:hypothetical protein